MSWFSQFNLLSLIHFTHINLKPASEITYLKLIPMMIRPQNTLVLIISFSTIILGRTFIVKRPFQLHPVDYQSAASLEKVIIKIWIYSEVLLMFRMMSSSFFTMILMMGGSSVTWWWQRLWWREISCRRSWRTYTDRWSIFWRLNHLIYSTKFSMAWFKKDILTS